MSALILTACGGSGSQNSSAVGGGDKAICQTITRATADYNAKNIDAWVTDLRQVAALAGSAKNSAILGDAKDVERAYGGQPAKKRLGNSFAGLGGYSGFVGLQKTCARLHL
jgi:hypothetical protein